MANKMNNINKDILDDMDTFSEIGNSISEALISSIESNNNINNIDSLRKSMLPDISEDDAKSFSRIILRLYGTFENSELPAREFVNDLLEAIKKKSEAHYEKIKKYQEILIKIISLKQIKIVFDSMSIEFSYEKILNDVEILTSIRPIFSNENNEILSSVISHSLDINYFSPSRENVRISLLLDRDDIEKIKSSCEKALKREILIKNNQLKFNIFESEND